MGKLVGLIGHAGSGKNLVSEIAAELSRCTSLAMADPMKRICQEVFDFSDEQLWGPSEMRNKPDERYKRHDPTSGPRAPQSYLTPRYALQRLGSEWGRDCYEHVWVDLCIRQAKKCLSDKMENTVSCTKCNHPLTERTNRFDFVFITDVRFVNEAARIKAEGGELWKIERPDHKGVISGGIANHVSEADIDTPLMNSLITAVIDNSGDKADLRKKVRKLVAS